MDFLLALAPPDPAGQRADTPGRRYEVDDSIACPGSWSKGGDYSQLVHRVDQNPDIMAQALQRRFVERERLVLLVWNDDPEVLHPGDGACLLRADQGSCTNAHIAGIGCRIYGQAVYPLAVDEDLDAPACRLMPV